mgnify:CR=1 FL=1
MNKMCDFDSIVIGGGMIGSSIAFGLAKQDEKVAMIDEGDNALRAARGNFGLIWVQGKGEKNSSYADLTLQSAKKWPRFNNELMALTKIDIGFEQKGGFDFCLNQEEFDERIILLKHITENSNEQFSYEMFNHEELAKKLPKIGPEVVGASYSSWDGHVNPLLLLRSLHKGFQELGGKLLTHSVSDIKYNDSYFSVQAKNSVINSNKVILAAGFSNQNLAPKIGLKMSLFPQRGQILVTEKIKPFLDYPTGLIRQTNEGGLLLGDSHEDVGFDDGTNLQTMQQIAQRVTTIFPFLNFFVTFGGGVGSRVTKSTISSVSSFGVSSTFFPSNIKPTVFSAFAHLPLRPALTFVFFLIVSESTKAWRLEREFTVIS